MIPDARPPPAPIHAFYPLQVVNCMRSAMTTISPVAWLVTLPQLISRICHKQVDVAEVLQVRPGTTVGKLATGRCRVESLSHVKRTWSGQASCRHAHVQNGPCSRCHVAFACVLVCGSRSRAVFAYEFAFCGIYYYCCLCLQFLAATPKWKWLPPILL